MEGIFCKYDIGMFALEPRDRIEETEVGLAFAHEYEREGTAFHEAGHAVLKFALGLGLSRIALRTTIKKNHDGQLAIAYHGKTSAPKLEIGMRGPRRFDLEIFTAGISAAAGPAAERKWSLFRKHPVRTRNGGDGDHASIERLGDILEKHGRDRLAFRRFIWRRAQIALEDTTIWDPVEQLAEFLNDQYWRG